MDSGEHNRPPGVVITGVGLTTSLGLDAAATWSAIRAGRVGLGPMPAMESTLPEGSIGGQAVALPEAFEPALPREARYLRWVIMQALRSAGTSADSGNPSRRSIILGTTLHGIRAGGRYLRGGGPEEFTHFLAGSVTRLATAGLGLGGMSATTCSACSSSLGAIALGVTLLETSQADLVVAGGYDVITEYAWAGFNSLRLVARRAVLPFARDREGMMLAEGYAVVVLERAEVARARGASPRAAVQGWGESADSHHMTQPDPTGAGAARAMRSALARAGVRPGQISMIAAHATATPDNDASEHAAMSSVFAGSLAETPVIGFKSYLGHTLGGAGAVELILSAHALRDGWIPPCANVSPEQAEFAPLRLAPPQGLHTSVERTLNMSLGFGGANTCVILGRGAARDHPPHRRMDSPVSEPDVWITGSGLILPGVSDVSGLISLLDQPRNVRLPAEPRVISEEQLSSIFAVRRARRLSMCVRLTIAAVALAVRQAKLEGDAERLSSADAMLASTHGSAAFCSEYFGQIVRDGVLAANPVLFAEGVPNAAAAHVSTNFGIRGACQTIIGSRTAGLDALALAAARVRSGASHRVIVCAAEETFRGIDLIHRSFGLLRDGDAGQGFVATPGAVAFIVEARESARERGAVPLAKVQRTASASSLDARAVTLGASDPRSRVLAQVPAGGVILPSCNGTWIDRAEAVAFRRRPDLRPLESLTPRIGELFSAGPLLALLHALARRDHREFTALCTDWSGAAAAVSLAAV